MNIYSINEKKPLLGKILIILTILTLALMIYELIKFPFLSIDEWYTRGIVALSFNDIITAAAIDVHPPLYYLILKGGYELLNALHITFDVIIYEKIMSIIPYIIIFAISLTKIRKDYGYLTAGLFSFTLITMSGFFIQFLTARMYSWCILFLVLTFLCVNGILKKNDMKSWILLAIFGVLCGYTHYIAAMTVVSIYIILFAYTLLKNKSDVKKWLISTVIGIICYLPWLFIFINQLGSVKSSYWIEKLTLTKIIEFFGYILTYKQNTVQIASAILIFITMAIIVKKFLENKDSDNTYAVIGVLTFVLTILIGSIISFTFKPILINRYIIGAVAIFWLSFSIFLGKDNFKKYSTLIILALIIIGGVNVAIESKFIMDTYDETISAYEFLDSINNNDSIIIFTSINKYLRFDYNLDNVYMIFTNYYLFNETDNLTEFTSIGDTQHDFINISLDELKKYENKTVYLFTSTNPKLNNDTGLIFEQVEIIKPCGIYKIST